MATHEQCIIERCQHLALALLDLEVPVKQSNTFEYNNWPVMLKLQYECCMKMVENCRDKVLSTYQVGVVPCIALVVVSGTAGKTNENIAKTRQKVSMHFDG